MTDFDAAQESNAVLLGHTAGEARRTEQGYRAQRVQVAHAGAAGGQRCPRAAPRSPGTRCQKALVSPRPQISPGGFSYEMLAPVTVSVTVILYSTPESAP